MAAQIKVLKDSYKDGLTLIELAKIIRGPNNKLSGKYSLKQTHLDHLFQSSVWKKSHDGGHRKVTHVLTGIVVEYSDHSKKIDPGAATTILDRVQIHLNILSNIVFKFQFRGWTNEPDYDQSLIRYNQWRDSLLNKDVKHSKVNS